jgi:hypothetical protein
VCRVLPGLDETIAFREVNRPLHALARQAHFSSDTGNSQRPAVDSAENLSPGTRLPVLCCDPVPFCKKSSVGAEHLQEQVSQCLALGGPLSLVLHGKRR